MLLSPFVPPSHSYPSLCPQVCSLCLHLHCCPANRMHQYHLSRSHVYALIYDICFSLSDLTSLCTIASLHLGQPSAGIHSIMEAFKVTLQSWWCHPWSIFHVSPEASWLEFIIASVNHGNGHGMQLCQEAGGGRRGLQVSTGSILFTRSQWAESPDEQKKGRGEQPQSLPSGWEMKAATLAQSLGAKTQVGSALDKNSGQAGASKPES